jgi:hypothetical protein
VQTVTEQVFRTPLVPRSAHVCRKPRIQHNNAGGLKQRPLREHHLERQDFRHQTGAGRLVARRGSLLPTPLRICHDAALTRPQRTLSREAGTSPGGDSAPACLRAYARLTGAVTTAGTQRCAASHQPTHGNARHTPSSRTTIAQSVTRNQRPSPPLPRQRRRRGRNKNDNNSRCASHSHGGT